MGVPHYLDGPHSQADPHEHDHSHAHAQQRGHGHANAHERDDEPRRGASPPRRDFLTQLFGGALAGVSVLEMALSRAAWARALAPAVGGPKLFDIEKVAHNVYLAVARPRRFINSSSAIFVNSRDVLVVDSQNQPSATASLLNQIRREVTTKPVRYVVNSHFHDDHVQGNSEYTKLGHKVDFIASAATAELMKQEVEVRLKDVLEKSVPSQLEKASELVANARSAQERAFWEEQLRQLHVFHDEMKIFTLELPTITLTREHVIHDREHDLHVEFHGRAHTAGDVVVFSPQKRVVATGDMILGTLPYMPDAYPKSWPRTVDSVGRLAFDKILPAHGPVMNRGRMVNMRDFIEECTARVDEAKKAGKSLEETRASITLDSLRTFQADGYGQYMLAVRDGAFPHWERTFLGQNPDPQRAVSGMIGTIYRNIDKE